MKRIKTFLTNQLHQGLVKKTVQLYFLLLGISLVFYLLSPWFPEARICTTMFQMPICPPVGLFIGMILNLPGYFIVGNILPFISKLHWSFSLIAVIIVSMFFYAALAKLVDVYKRDGKKDKVSLLVLTGFVVLVFVFLGLLLLV